MREREVPPLSHALASLCFEAHPDAMLAVSRTGELLGANRGGRELIARRTLRTTAGLLTAGSAARTRALRERIAAALRGSREPCEIELPSASGGALAIRVVPLSALDGALVIACERKPGRRAGTRFGFTPAASLVAEHLTRGFTVHEIAQQLGITVETVRCHLKQAFAKARVHRQAELVALLLGG